MVGEWIPLLRWIWSHNKGCPLFTTYVSILLKEVGKHQRAAWKIILHHGINLLQGCTSMMKPAILVSQSTSMRNQSTLSPQTSLQLLLAGHTWSVRPAGSKITLWFPRLYIYIYVCVCASVLITYAIITSHTLLPFHS